MDFFEYLVDLYLGETSPEEQLGEARVKVSSYLRARASEALLLYLILSDSPVSPVGLLKSVEENRLSFV